MIQFLRKNDQYCGLMFAGHFFFNKPVYNGSTRSVAPYSSIFYFSHAVTDADCEFPLHPHEGFEIMTFILDGTVQHFDTETKVWTNLDKGDFQIIYAGSGVKHSEKLLKGSRTFQIWFDPNFREALNSPVAYSDYHAKDFPSQVLDGLKTTQLVGGGTVAKFATDGLNIKRIELEANQSLNYKLDNSKSYTFYVLNGSIAINGEQLAINDAVRIIAENTIDLQTSESTELFILELPEKPSYVPIWEQ